MKNFSFQIRDTPYNIVTANCIVLSSSKSQETKVFSEKGVGDSIEVKSETTEYTHFWLKNEKGVEGEFKCRSSIIKLREGHKVTLIMNDDKDNSVLAIYNHNARENFIVAPLLDFFKLRESTSGFWFIYLIFISITIILSLRFSNAFVLILNLFMFFVIKSHLKVRKSNELLDLNLESRINEISKNLLPF